MGDAIVTTDSGRREMFNGMLALKPTVDLRVSRSLQSADIGLVTGTWTLSGTTPDGSAIAMDGGYCDDLRRQPDGNWLFVVDNPMGLG